MRPLLPGSADVPISCGATGGCSVAGRSNSGRGSGSRPLLWLHSPLTRVSGSVPYRSLPQAPQYGVSLYLPHVSQYQPDPSASFLRPLVEQAIITAAATITRTAKTPSTGYRFLFLHGFPAGRTAALGFPSGCVVGFSAGTSVSAPGWIFGDGVDSGFCVGFGVGFCVGFGVDFCVGAGFGVGVGFGVGLGVGLGVGMQISSPHTATTPFSVHSAKGISAYCR